MQGGVNINQGMRGMKGYILYLASQDEAEIVKIALFMCFIVFITRK